MVTIAALWLPILLSAVLVWIASAIAWTAAPHHKSDFRVIPNQDDVLDLVGSKNLTPGQYWFPNSSDRKDMAKPEMVAKMEKGPVGVMTIMPNGRPNMGKAMALSFVFYLGVGIMVAYLAGRTIAAGAEYLAVFRVAGTVAFVAHVGALFPDSTWFGTPWKRTWKSVGDGFVYALLTGGAFGAFWPGM
ncbi:MAG: hypothetical protein O7I93_07725 [Gemmatimonadetes bacterium]|nr:hypothetical protein [Gemmatimonadota bacterium]